jgi:hypothetical protein
MHHDYNRAPSFGLTCCAQAILWPEVSSNANPMQTISLLWHQEGTKRFRPPVLLVPLFSATVLAAVSSTAVGKALLWDTVTPQAETLNLEDRTAWKAVPNDLLQLEAQPAKASSDPGYYGREFLFKGDAVVENNKFVVVFWSAKGQVVIYPRSSATSQTTDSETLQLGKALAELTSLESDSAPTTIKHVELIRNAADRVVLQVTFSAKGAPETSATFSFDQSEIIEAKPAAATKGMTIRAPLSYGIAPSFVGDDLIFAPADYPSAKQLTIPADNFFLGLVNGENSQLVLAWPAGEQRLRLNLAQGHPSIDSLDFENDGQSFYLAALSAPGIWHKETLEASFLEKDTKVNWQKPFAARWKTQLYEEETKTTFAFRQTKGDIWRGVPGSYNYPVWFEGDSAFYHLSKKVPPKGESIIYFLEGQDTPTSVSTPVDILNGSLGRQFAEPILDLAGRKLRTHHRRGGEGVRRACTCGCTEAIQAVFENHEEASNKEYIRGALDDMVYFVHCHVERINEYRKFAEALTGYLNSRASSTPELKTYLDDLAQIVGRIPQEYDVQKDNMKSFQYADDLVQKTLALTHKADTNNLTAYMDLLKAWRGMGGAQDYVLAQCHTITRRLCQAAGYGCAEQPKALAIAKEVRDRCRKILRTPDGYEIWADY